MARGVRIAAALLAVLGVAVASALVLPSLIDWNRHRAAVAAALAEATGHPVRIDGDLDVAVLPVPRLAVHDVAIANVVGGEASDLARFAAVEARLAPGALLSGRLRITTVRLTRPVLHLEILPDGRGNWALAPPIEAAGREGQDAKAGGNARITLDRLRIEDGTITYRDARSGRRERLDEIDAEISADLLAGPFAAKGRLRRRGLPLDFDATMGAATQDAPVPVEFALRLAQGEAALGFEGALRLAAAPRLQGQLVVSGPDLSHALAELTGAPEEAPPPLLAQAFRAEAALSAGSGAAELSAIRLALGDLRAQGAARARFGADTEIEARLAFAPIDLDAPLRAAPQAAGEAGQGQGGAGIGAALSAFAPPPDLRLALSARAPAVKYRGGVIQDAEILASLSGRTATLSRLSARLPGGSRLSLAGAAVLAPPADRGAAAPMFRGIAEFSSDSLRGFLTWAGLDLGVVPSDRLTRLDFVSRIEAGPDGVALTGIDARLDAAQLSGDLAYRPARPRPLFALDLALDRLNADAYLATGSDAPPSLTPPVPAQRREREGEGPLAMLAALDGRFALRVGVLTVNAMPLHEVSARGRLEDGLLRLDPLLISDAGGTRITLSGTIGELTAAQGPLLDLQAQLRHQSLAGFARAFGLPLDPPAAAGGIAIEALARGTPRVLKLSSFAATLGPTRIAGRGALTLAGPRPALALDLTGGALDLDALLGSRAGADADREAGAEPSGALPWSSAPLDLSALALLDADIRARLERATCRGWRLDEPAFTLKLRDGTMSVSDAAARLFSGALRLDASLGGGVGPLPSLTASLRLDRADAAQAGAALLGRPFLTGRLDAVAEIAASGASPHDLVSDLQGAVEFAAEDGVLRGIDLPRLSAQLDELGSREGIAALIATSLAGGETPYRRIGGTAEIRNGILETSDIQADVAAAAANLRARIDLPRYRLDAQARFGLTDYPGAPAIGLAFEGPLDAPERRIDSEELRRYAAAHLLRAGVDRLIGDRPGGEVSQDEGGAPEQGGALLRDLDQDLLRGLGAR